MNSPPIQHANDQPGAPAELSHGDLEMVVRRMADELAFGVDPSRFIGAGLEYAQSRPYMPGDPVKSIDWRITARLNRPFVKEYDTLKRMSLYLVVDTSASMAIASTSLTKHDMAVWIAAAVGLVGQRHMRPVAVVGGGERETRLTPSLRIHDLWHSLEPLRMGDVSEQTNLVESLDRLRTRIDRTSVVMVLTDLHEPGIADAFCRMSQKHDCIAVHLVDPAEYGKLRAGFFLGQEAETGRTFLAHGRTHWQDPSWADKELARSGVSCIRLRTDEPFIAPLRHFLAYRAVMERAMR